MVLRVKTNKSCTLSVGENCNGSNKGRAGNCEEVLKYPGRRRRQHL